MIYKQIFMIRFSLKLLYAMAEGLRGDNSVHRRVTDVKMEVMYMP